MINQTIQASLILTGVLTGSVPAGVVGHQTTKLAVISKITPRTVAFLNTKAVFGLEESLASLERPQTPPAIQTQASVAVNLPASTPKPQVDQPDQTSIYDDVFRKFGSEFGVDPEKLKRIAFCESRFNPGAVSGPYGGMYQYLASTWRSTRKAMGLDENPDLRFNPEEAIRTTAWKIAHGGIGAWPVCGRR